MLVSRCSRILAGLLAGLLLGLVLGSCAVRAGLPESGRTADETGLAQVLALDDLSALPFSQEVTKGRLDNGLTYLVRPNSYPQGRVQLFLAVHSGSLQESDDQQGLAHFVEHMAFNGTANFPKGEMVAFLQGLGMRFGPEVNAYTSFDRTVYGIEVPADNPDALDKGLAILNDWARNLTLEPAAVADERSIINEEWRLRQGADDRLQQQQLPVILEGSRHVSRLPIGKPEVFNAAQADQLRRYYRDWYRPERMAVVVVGDVDAAATTGKLLQVFAGTFPNNPAPAEPDVTVPPPRKGRFAYVASQDKELTHASLQVLVKLPPKPAGQRAQYREGLLWALAGNVINSRFQQELTKPDCPYIQASAGMGRYVADARFLIFSVLPKEGREADALRAIFELRASVARYGFTEGEWELEEKALLAYFDQALQEQADTESRQLAEELVRHYLDDEVVPGIAWEHDEMTTLAAVAGATHGTALVRQAWNGDDITLLLSQPAGAVNPFPDEAGARSLVETYLAIEPPPPQATNVDTSLVPVPPQSGRIVRETSLPASGLIRWELSNGMVVYVKATDFKKDEIIFTAISPGGLSKAGDDSFASARHASAMAAWSGLGRLDRNGLEQALKGRTMGANLRVGDFFSTLDGASNQVDLEGLMQLIHLNFTGTRLDGSAVAAYLESARTLVAKQEQDPETYYYQTINRLANGGGKRFQPSSEAELAAVKPEAALDFMQQVLEPGTWVFCFAGSLEPAAIRPLVETWLASIPAGKVQTWQYPLIQRPSPLEVTVSRGSAPKGLGYQAWYVNQPYSYGSLVRARVFNELLDIILLNRVREEKGAVYSIGAAVGYNSIPNKELYLGVEYGCDPGRAKEVRTEVGNILQEIASGRFAPADLEKARQIIRESYRADFRKNATWARTIPQLVVLRQQAEEVFLDWENQLDAVSIQDMQALAALFDPAAAIVFTLGPEQL